MRIGMGMVARPMIRHRLTVECRIGIGLRCTVCGQHIASNRERIPLERQIADLTERETTRGNRYNPCLGCGQYQEDPSPTSRRRIDSHIRFLRRMRERIEKREAKLLASVNWPKDTESLVGQYWDGRCPLDRTEMLLNTSDRFECPTCRIQIGTDGRVHVLRDKGLLKFKTKAVVIGGEIFHNQIMATDELPGVGAFRIEEDHRISK